MSNSVEKSIGFVQGVAYAASMMERHNISDAYDLIKESGIPISDFRNHADEYDIEALEDTFKSLE